jgi:Peptidase family M48
LLDVFGSDEGVDWLSLGALVAAPIVANLIQGAFSRQSEYQADLEAVAGRSGRARPRHRANRDGAEADHVQRGPGGAVRSRLPRLLSSHPDPKDRIRRLRQSVAKEGVLGPAPRRYATSTFAQAKDFSPRDSIMVSFTGGYNLLVVSTSSFSSGKTPPCAIAVR